MGGRRLLRKMVEIFRLAPIYKERSKVRNRINDCQTVLNEGVILQFIVFWICFAELKQMQYSVAKPVCY